MSFLIRLNQEQTKIFQEAKQKLKNYNGFESKNGQIVTNGLVLLLRQLEQLEVNEKTIRKLKKRLKKK